MNEKIYESIDSIRKMVDGYVKDAFGEEKCLFDPIIREEDGQYYLGYMVVDFVDESKEDYRMKRPTKWILVDIISGRLHKVYDSKSFDYTTEYILPLDKIFNNSGSSGLFDSSNLVASSFLEWKSSVIKELENKFNKENNDIKVLKSGDDLISPSKFVISNIDSLLEEMHEELTFKLGGKIGELNKEYYTYLLDSIRKEYLDKGIINKELLSNYIELLKYLWPDFKEIITAFNNLK